MKGERRAAGNQWDGVHGEGSDVKTQVCGLEGKWPGQVCKRPDIDETCLAERWVLELAGGVTAPLCL